MTPGLQPAIPPGPQPAIPPGPQPAILPGLQPAIPGPGFQRRIGAFDAFTLVVGSMVGSGIFLVSAESGRLLGSPARLLLCWAVAGVLTLIGASACAELAAMLPEAGGPYVFLREAFGPLLSFLYGWTLTLVIQTGTIAAVATAFAKFAGVFAPAVSSSTILLRAGPFSLSAVQAVAVLVVLALTATNAAGLRTGTRVQNILTVVKVAAFGLLIVVCLLVRLSDRQIEASALSHFFAKSPGAPEGLALCLGFSLAMVGPLFSQSAWNNVTFAGGEVRDPGRTLPRALLWGCLLVSLLYVLANVGYERVLSFPALLAAPEQRVAAAAAQVVWPAGGARFMAAAILLSTLGCANGLILSGARVIYALSADHQLPAALSKLNSRRVPGRALLAQGIWAAFLVLSGTYASLLRYVVSAELLAFAAITAAVIVLREARPDAPRPYRTQGYPVLPALGILLTATLSTLLFLASPRTSLPGLALVSLGVPAYFLVRKPRGR